MFFRQRRALRRGNAKGASLRALHELLGEQSLSSQELLRAAEKVAQDDYYETLTQGRHQDPDVVLGFVAGYLHAEVQIRLPPVARVKDASIEEILRERQPGRYD